MSSVYRDPLLSLRARIQELSERAHELDGRLTDDAWQYLPAETVSTLRRLRDATSPRNEDPPEMQRVRQALEEYVDRLERTVKQAGYIEMAWSRPPEQAPDPEPRTIVGRPADSNEIYAFRQAFRRIDPKAAIELVASELPQPYFRARFSVGDGPFTMLMQPLSAKLMAQTLATSISRATPKLSLHPQAGLFALGAGLGLMRDTEVGPRVFDRTFVVNAAPEAARRLLTNSVQSALLELASSDVPTLEIKDGTAVLHWTASFQVRLTRIALHALAGLRQVRTRLALLKGPTASR